MNIRKQEFKRKVGLSLVLTMGFVIVFSFVSIAGVFGQAEAAVQTLSPERAEVLKFALIAAAGAFGFGAIGAGIAIANVGAAAMGAIGEKPEIAGQALIFIALAEGLVVFGFITALMILGKA